MPSWATSVGSFTAAGSVGFPGRRACEFARHTPHYTVVRKADGYEVREYDAYLVAEVSVEGGYREALSRGFRTLFAYISGENEVADKVSMTAPVLQKEADDAYRVAFVVP